VAIPTVGVFAKVRATLFNLVAGWLNTRDLCQSISAITASSAIGTTTTAILTLTGCTFKAGRAYSIENIGGAFADVDGRYADFAVFKTSTAGTVYGAFYRTRCGAGGVQTNCYGKIYVRRSAGSDLTTDIVLAVTASAGTVTHDASTNRPRALVVRDVGDATSYAWALAVT
jgi:hypothetical protein